MSAWAMPQFVPEKLQRVRLKSAKKRRQSEGSDDEFPETARENILIKSKSPAAAKLTQVSPSQMCA